MVLGPPLPFCNPLLPRLFPVLLQLVDVPESMQEVLLSCLIFYTVRLLVNRLAGMLPAPPAAAAAAVAPARPASAIAAGSSAAAGGAGVGKSRSEEQEAEGIKYEGYAEAIAAAQVRGRAGAAHPLVCCLCAGDWPPAAG
jgi:hypothetical protein